MLIHEEMAEGRDVQYFEDLSLDRYFIPPSSPGIGFGPRREAGEGTLAWPLFVPDVKQCCGARLS